MWSAWLVFCGCGFHCVCPLIDMGKRLVEVSWLEELVVGKLGLALIGRTMLCKSLIQFSTDGWGCVIVTSFKKAYASMPCGSQDCCTQCPWMWTHASAGDTWTLTGNLGSVSCGVAAPFSWVWCAQGFIFALQESVSPFLWKFCNQIPLASKVKSPGGSQSLWRVPRLGNLWGP